MVPTDELEQFPRHPWWRRLLIPLVVVVGVGLAFLVPATQDDEVPEFELDRLGAPGRLASEDLKGSPVVLNFFAGWCAPCREEAPLLQEAYEEYRDRGVRFIGIAANDTEERALDFVEEFGIEYDIAMSTDELEQELGINGLPQTLFVTRNWELSSVQASNKVGKQGPTAVLGAISRADLRAQIDSLLSD